MWHTTILSNTRHRFHWSIPSDKTLIKEEQLMDNMLDASRLSFLELIEDLESCDEVD